MLKKHKNKWAHHHKWCKICKKIKHPHHSHGVCWGCMNAWRYKGIESIRESVKKSNKKYYAKKRLDSKWVKMYNNRQKAYDKKYKKIKFASNG